MKAQREKMQLLVSQWQDSGVSQAEFARKNQHKLHGFRYWVSRLREKGGKEEDVPAFIRLNGFAPAQICIRYPNGVELLLPVQTPLVLLKGLIHVEARCSR